jgi:hypothetical protein
MSAAGSPQLDASIDECERRGKDRMMNETPPTPQRDMPLRDFPRPA